MTTRDDQPPLARGDGIAVWRRIADEIETDIAKSGLAAGAKLPTEQELAQRFGVNRHTVRRALASLSADGVVRATQGRGTYVDRARIAYPIGSRTRFTEILAAEGQVAGGEMTEASEVAADRTVSARLGVETGAPVLRIGLRRFANGIPVSLSVNHLPLPRFADFAEAFRIAGAVTPALAACGVGDYRRVETRVGARLALGEEATALDLGADRILLTVDSVNVDSDGVPIQLTRALFAAERIELVIGSRI